MGWTGSRIAAVVVGCVLLLVAVGLLGAGATGLWIDLTRRDAAGFVTTGEHEFSTTRSALATEPARLDSPGVGWLYSSVLLGDVRIRVTPVDEGSDVFVGIARSNDADRYLAGVSHALIADVWTEDVRQFDGATPGSLPASREFWAASAVGRGRQAISWTAANGSWTVVVMRPDGKAGIDVVADLGATYPALVPIASAALVLGLVFAIAGVLLIAHVIRRSRVVRIP